MLDSNVISVSFCTACMNRLNHLRQTLPTNLQNNTGCPSVEFVVLDYSSSDGLKEWIEKEMGNYLNTGRLVYYLANGFQYFHHAHAKNAAHRLARGEIVCNLDADNFTGQRFAEYLVESFSGKERLIVRAQKKYRGTFGRIAMRKIDFELIGGYDERMKFGWGNEDMDIINRASMMGFREHLIPIHSTFLKAIQHSRKDRIRHTQFQNQSESRQIHRVLSLNSIKRKEFIANRGKLWGNIN
jgi:predicted glycosyltransferase involved in capsule biosynthesis